MKKSAFTLAEAIKQIALPNCQRKFAFTLAEVFSPFSTNHRKSAFTLAEVLVTLGIIGVVSAMTVPSLMNHYQRQTYVTQLHKAYTETSQALMQFQTDKNAVSLKEAGLNSNASIRQFVKDYFKVITDCPDAVTPCLASQYRKLDGTVSKLTNSSRCMIIASGSTICPVYSGNGNILMQYGVDVNGPKGPNIVGRDFFLFYIYNNGVIDDLVLANPDKDGDGTWQTSTVAPLSKEDRELNFQKSCKSSTASFYHGCFGKILNDNWQMTY